MLKSQANLTYLIGEEKVKSKYSLWERYLLAVSGGAFLIGVLEVIVLGLLIGLCLSFLPRVESINDVIIGGGFSGFFAGIVWGIAQSIICIHYVAQAESWQDAGADHEALLIKLGEALQITEAGHRILRKGGAIYKVVIPRPEDDEFKVYVQEDRRFAGATIRVSAKIVLTVKPHLHSNDFLGFEPLELARIVASDSYLDVKAWIREFFMKAISDSPDYEIVIWECSQTGNTSALLRLIDTAIPTFNKIVRGKLSNILDARVDNGDYEITVISHAQMSSEKILEKGLRTL